MDTKFTGRMVRKITPPHDKNILAEVAKVTSFTQVKTMAKEDAVKRRYYLLTNRKGNRPTVDME